MDLTGMDVAEVRRVAAELKRQADGFGNTTRNVDGLLRQAQNMWRGPDVGDFNAIWNGRLRGNIDKLTKDLRELALTAEKNADDQQKTSDTLSGGAGGVGSGGPGAGGSGSGSGMPGGPIVVGGGGGGGGGGAWGSETVTGEEEEKEAKVKVSTPDKEWSSGDEVEHKWGDQKDAPKSPEIKMTVAEGEKIYGDEAKAEGKVGDDNVGATGEASAMAGVKTDYEVSVGSDGVKAEASVMAGVQASAKGEAYAGPLALNGEVEAMAGAKAEGGVSVGGDGVHANVEAFAGAKIEASGGVDVGGVGVGGTVEGWAGIGVEADLDVGMKDGKITIGGTFGAALGVGGSASGNVTIDLNKVEETLTSAPSKIGNFVKSLW